MKPYTIVVDRRPKGKARPRHHKKGQVFTPKGTLDEEKEVRKAWEEAGGTTFHTPVEVHLVYAPDCATITVHESPHNAKVLRGDLDNYVKLTLDALNKVAWDDDGQVVRITAVKVDRMETECNGCGQALPDDNHTH
mgnify:FL=1